MCGRERRGQRCERYPTGRKEERSERNGEQ